MRYFALILSLVLPLVAHAQSADFRPLVLEGRDTPLLLGADVTAPVCFAWTDGVWEQCPLQIDERDFIDRGSAYRRDLYPEFYDVDSVYHYTAPQDYPNPRMDPTVPADSDPLFDEDDELVLMARFFGEQAELQVLPPPYAPETIQEVEFEGRYVYLFAPTQPLDQSAGVDLVSYSFNLLAGDFPDDYDFSGKHYDQYHAEPNYHNEGDYLAANPEYSPVETAYYKTSFEDRWIQRELQFTDGAGGYGPDILDRVKYAGRPDYTGSRSGCGRTIWTGSAERGTLGIQKDGPLRALRYAQGYNSGGYNHVLYRLYERYMDYEMAHTMHRTPGASMWYDLAPEASGMTYYSNIYPSGVTVDGVPDYATEPRDDIFPAAYIEWDYLIGDQGSMVGTWSADHNLREPVPRSYYEDDTTPEIQNCSGDRMAYGNFGNTYVEPAATQEGIAMYSTDPREPEAFYEDGTLRYLRVQRRAVPAAPNLTLSEAADLRDRMQAPVLYAVAERSLSGADATPPVIDGALDPDRQEYAGTVRDMGTGVATVALGADAVNLALDVPPFTEGSETVSFTATPIDASQAASGTLLATDVQGNQASQFIEIAVPGVDLEAPVFTSSVNGAELSGTVTDDRPNDSGLLSLALDAASSNLTLDADAFATGASAAAFTVTLTDPAIAGEGSLVATDVAGNESTLPVSLEPTPVGPAYDLAATGTYVYNGPDAGTITITVENAGVNAFTSVRVRTRQATDVTIAEDVIVLGALAPGEAKDAVFAFSGAGPAAEAKFQAQDTQVRRDEADLDNNDVTVVLEGGGSTGPTVTLEGAANADGSAFEGTASASDGLASVTLSADAVNLSLMVDPFDSGTTGPVAFTVVRVDESVDGSGHVVAEDVNGLEESLLVELGAAPPPPEYDLAASATYVYAGPDAGTITVTVENVGTSAFTSTRVRALQAADVTIAEDVIVLGALAPGEAKDAVFAFSGAGPAAEAKFQAQDTQVRRDEADLDNNDVIVVLTPSGEDAAGPAISGEVAMVEGAPTFDGRADESRPNDTGVASVAMREGSTNVALAVDSFAEGDPEATFTVTLIDADLSGDGVVVATDVAGNASEYAVALVPPSSDTNAPVVTGSYGPRSYDGTATDSQAGDSGIASVELSADAENLVLTVDPFEAGASSVGFTVKLADLNLPGSGSVVATDLAGNEGSVFISGNTRTAGLDGHALASDGAEGMAPAPAAASATPEPAPEDGSLSPGAYPNPLVRAATLRFYLAERGAVRVAVYDVTGRRVALVHDGPLAAGWQTLALDAAEWPSGVYVWRVVSSERAATGRVTVLQ